MNISCDCGEIFADETDNLSYKAHVIPDQDWVQVFNAIDHVIQEAAAGNLSIEAAQTQMRCVLASPVRTAYQCRVCGRLMVEDTRQQFHSFLAATEETPKQILRSHEDSDAA
jgi:hypothetical protein